MLDDEFDEAALEVGGSNTEAEYSTLYNIEINIIIVTLLTVYKLLSSYMWYIFRSILYFCCFCTIKLTLVFCSAFARY